MLRAFTVDPVLGFVHCLTLGASGSQILPQGGVGMVHDLKCWPPVFQDMVDGRKPFEFRKDDRHFAVGDMLNLREWVPYDMDGVFTGRKLAVVVTYKIDGGQFGIPEGYCIMAVSPAPQQKQGGEPPAPNRASTPSVCDGCGGVLRGPVTVTLCDDCYSLVAD